jgi:tRNA (guanine26-N2/guanine27-N2)-dimethyltransferase
LDVTLNDAQPSACEIIRKNAELNGLDVRVMNKSAAPLLYEREKYDCVDIDPFGTPAPFMEAAFQSVAPKGLMFVTATDIASLAGVYQKPCYKKYGVASCRTTFERELGMRALLSYVFRTGMKYEFMPEPLLCYSSMHYTRLYLRFRKGQKYVNRGFSNLGWAAYGKDEDREIFPLNDPLPKPGAKLIGPIWIGSTHDKKFLESFYHEKKILQQVYGELDFPLYWDVHRLSSVWKSGTPKMDELFARLEKKGYRASRTHCCGQCVKTNADYRTVKACFMP